MDSNLLEAICKKYKLSREEHQRIGDNINKIMLCGKTQSQNPIAIINIAPPGSGKTGLNGMALNQFQDNNAVIINSDELKTFHPQIDEIAKLYPEYYTKVTNQESNPWTDSLFEQAVVGKYNIIFEGTGRNIKLLRNMIDQMTNYRIIVRGMAVNELNCLMSIIERYEGQIREKGWGRLVTVSHFYKAYEEMIDTIKQIEDSNIVNCVEVYIRGNKPTQPIKIYTNATKEFESAKLAVITGREKDRITAYKYFETNFKSKTIENVSFLEEKEILEKIISLYDRNNELDER